MEEERSEKVFSVLALALCGPDTWKLELSHTVMVMEGEPKTSILVNTGLLLSLSRHLKMMFRTLVKGAMCKTLRLKYPVKT